MCYLAMPTSRATYLFVNSQKPSPIQIICRALVTLFLLSLPLVSVTAAPALVNLDDPAIFN